MGKYLNIFNKDIIMEIVALIFFGAIIIILGYKALNKEDKNGRHPLDAVTEKPTPITEIEKTVVQPAAPVKIEEPVVVKVEEPVAVTVAQTTPPAEVKPAAKRGRKKAEPAAKVTKTKPATKKVVAKKPAAKKTKAV